MVLLLFFLYFSIVQYIRIVVEPLEKNAPQLAISRLRDALSYKAVNIDLILSSLGNREGVVDKVIRVGSWTVVLEERSRGDKIHVAVMD